MTRMLGNWLQGSTLKSERECQCQRQKGSAPALVTPPSAQMCTQGREVYRCLVCMHA